MVAKVNKAVEDLLATGAAFRVACFEADYSPIDDVLERCLLCRFRGKGLGVDGVTALEWPG
jgi:hypothetical protein